MRAGQYAILAGALLAAACGAGEPNIYPEAARTPFARGCPTGEPLCDCTWDGITRALTHEEYVAALDRFKQEGLMDPRVSRARAECLERQH